MVVPAGKETPGKRPQKCTQSNVGESVGFPFSVDSAAYLSMLLRPQLEIETYFRFVVQGKLLIVATFSLPIRVVHWNINMVLSG